MNIRTRLVGAFETIIMSLAAVMTVTMLIVLLGASFSSLELLGKRGSVTIQQIS